MFYTVGEIAELLNIPPSTIRYYDRKGLLPFVSRSKGGIRQFSEDDRRRMENILLLRRFGLSIQEIEQYVRLEEQGPSTASERHAILKRRKAALENEIKDLTDTLALLKKSCRRFHEQQ